MSVGSLSQARKKAEEWIANNVNESIINEAAEDDMSKADDLIKEIDGVTAKFENVSILQESNAFQIASYNSFGELTVLSSKGVRYIYSKINPFILNKIKTFLRHKNYGPAWQILNKFSVEKLEDENS